MVGVKMLGLYRVWGTMIASYDTPENENTTVNYQIYFRKNLITIPPSNLTTYFLMEVEKLTSCFITSINYEEI